MGLKKSNKGFVFTFLCFFIAILIFGFGFYNMATSDYKSTTDFNKGRIVSVDNEIKYFKNVYVKDAFKFVAYNTIKSLINYSRNKSNYVSLNKNYSMLNKLIFEGITNSSFNHNLILSLKDKSIYNFTSEFQKVFLESYKGNLKFKLLKINIFESQPYYLSFQVLASYNVSMEDKLSTWNSEEYFEVSFPVYNLDDPGFVIQINKSFPIRPYDLYYSNQNWTLETFNQTVAETYSTIYTYDEFKYTLGDSFLNRLLNLTTSSYGNVLAFFSFDYDEKKFKVFDSSGSNLTSKLFANSYLLMDFENSSKDLTSYNNSFNNFGVNLTGDGIFYYGGEFNGLNTELNISKDKFNLNFTNKISISVWINPVAYVDNSGFSSSIFSYGDANNNILNLRLNSSGKLIFEVGSHNGGNKYLFISQRNISLNNWTNIIAIFDGDSGDGRIYLNGKLDNLMSDFSFENSTPILNFLKSGKSIGIGNIPGNSNYFNGKIDELGIYTKSLNKYEIASLFEKKRIVNLDYKKILHGKGVEFDGDDDYLEVEQNIFSSPLNEFTIEVWLKIRNFSSDYSTIFNLPKDLTSNVLSFNLRNDSLEFITTHVGGGEDKFNVSYNFSLNKNYYLVFQDNSTNKNIFINGNLINSSSVITSNLFNNNLNLTLAVMNNNVSNTSSHFFNGIIDEIKILNKSLSSSEIKQNYYNYNSFGKGCCNYLTLMNLNTMGFNSTLYGGNVSSSSRLFLNNYLRGISSNVTVWALTNFTSNETNKNYYNFLVDSCMIMAYNLPFGNQTSFDLRHIGNYNNVCGNLIKSGIY